MTSYEIDILYGKRASALKALFHTTYEKIRQTTARSGLPATNRPERPARDEPSGAAEPRSGGHKVSSNFLETLPVKIPVWKSTVLSSGEIRLFPLYIQFVLLCF